MSPAAIWKQKHLETLWFPFLCPHSKCPSVRISHSPMIRYRISFPLKKLQGTAGEYGPHSKRHRYEMPETNLRKFQWTVGHFQVHSISWFVLIRWNRIDIGDGIMQMKLREILSTKKLENAGENPHLLQDEHLQLVVPASCSAETCIRRMDQSRCLLKWNLLNFLLALPVQCTFSEISLLEKNLM